MITVYTTRCPKCRVLVLKLQQKHIKFEEVDDVTEMQRLGIQSAPAIKVGDEIKLFSDAIKWVNEQEDQG